MKFIIIGPRSVGKTTVSKVLSKKVKTKFFDLDFEVEKELRNIDEFIEKNGIDAYRKKERVILLKLIEKLPSKFVLAIGGGTVCSHLESVSQKNIKTLKRLGTLIYLCPSDNKKDAMKILMERENKRGKFFTKNKTAFLFKKRIRVYEKIYGIKLITGRKTPSKIADQIISKFQNSIHS